MRPDSCPTVSLLDGETPLGITFPVTAAVFAVTVAVRTIADAVKLKEAV
ncbi:hypothetical protein [Neisseria sp. oral taxon 014]|nr:hypothetical protein [Neisseria sp. oral taxon 014]